MSKLQIGITGGIGAGKSIICKIFRSLEIPVYDADSMAKALMVKDSNLVAAIKKAFGKEAYLSSGQLNRVYLAEKVFHRDEHVKTLNSLVHPRVAEHYEEWANFQLQKAPYIIKEAALLFESGAYKSLDKIINVSATEETRIKRVLGRDPHRSVEQVKAIMAKQLSDEEREKLADYVIVNDGHSAVMDQVLKLDKIFRKEI